MKYELRSAVPSLIKYPGGEAFLEEGQALVFDKPEKLFVYPAAKGYSSFVLDFNSNRCPIKRFELADRLLYFFEHCSNPQISVKEKINIDGSDVNFIISQNYTSIDFEKTSRRIETITPKSYEVFSREKTAILKIKSQNQQQIIIFNTETSQLATYTYDKIEIIENEVFCEKFGKEEKYIFSNGELIKVRSVDNQTKNSKTIGMQFLQKVKYKEYKDASALLSTYLASSEEKIAAYFGEIDNILPLSENTFLLDKKTGPLVVKLDLQNDKIINIEMID